MSAWIELPQTEIPASFAEFVGGHPLVAQTLFRRGITTPQAARAFIDPNAYTPAPPEDLPDLSLAADRLERAIRQGESIWVWGDFDVDGQTSTALLVQTLRSLGADPGFHIPVRARESHGINIPNLEPIIAAGAKLLLTCDTGITAHEAIDYANSRGLEVIVTDHHTLAETLPPALACVNPRRFPQTTPSAPCPAWEWPTSWPKRSSAALIVPQKRINYSTWSPWASSPMWPFKPATPAICSSAAWLPCAAPSAPA